MIKILLLINLAVSVQMRANEDLLADSQEDASDQSLNVEDIEALALRQEPKKTWANSGFLKRIDEMSKVFEQQKLSLEMKYEIISQIEKSSQLIYNSQDPKDWDIVWSGVEAIKKIWSNKKRFYFEEQTIPELPLKPSEEDKTAQWRAMKKKHNAKFFAELQTIIETKAKEEAAAALAKQAEEKAAAATKKVEEAPAVIGMKRPANYNVEEELKKEMNGAMQKNDIKNQSSWGEYVSDY